MKKGFTLMEMLAVLLLVTLLMSLALPVYRSIRFEMRRSQAEQAAVKMAEAMRSFYVQTKGGLIVSGVNPLYPADPDTADSSDIMAAPAGTCTSRIASGIPSYGSATFGIEQLFACGFLSYKDFQLLPYKFHANGASDPLVTVVGQPGSGKYENVTFCVRKNMTIQEGGNCSGS